MKRINTYLLALALSLSVACGDDTGEVPPFEMRGNGALTSQLAPEKACEELAEYNRSILTPEEDTRVFCLSVAYQTDDVSQCRSQFTKCMDEVGSLPPTTGVESDDACIFPYQDCDLSVEDLEICATFQAQQLREVAELTCDDFFGSRPPSSFVEPPEACRRVQMCDSETFE